MDEFILTENSEEQIVAVSEAGADDDCEYPRSRLVAVRVVTEMRGPT